MRALDYQSLDECTRVGPLLYLYHARKIPQSLGFALDEAKSLRRSGRLS